MTLCVWNEPKGCFKKYFTKLFLFWYTEPANLALHNRTADWPAVTVMNVLTERTLRCQPLLGPLQMTDKWTSNRPT